jgi:carbon-monoxide dehydrogenase medium subunit
MRVVSTAGDRSIALREFFVGPRETVLDPTDVVVAIEVPAPPSGTGAASLRQGGRMSLSLPISAAAAVVVMDGIRCRDAAVALGAVAPTPIMAPAAGEAVKGRELSEEVLREAGELAAEAATPIDDLRASMDYRLELVKVLTQRVLRAAAERA